MTGLSATRQDARIQELNEALVHVRSAIKEFSDAMKYINDAGLNDLLRPIHEVADRILVHHQDNPRPNIADDIAHLRSLFSRSTIPRTDTDFGPLLTLKELRAARGNVLAELDQVLLSARELGWLPSNPDLPDISAEVPYFGLEALLTALLRRLDDVEHLLKGKVLPEGVPGAGRSDIQVILVNEYAESMIDDIDLVRVEASRKKVVDLVALSRAIGSIGSVTADFVETVRGFRSKATAALHEAAEAIRPTVRRVVSGLGTLVRQITRRQNGARKQAEPVSSLPPNVPFHSFNEVDRAYNAHVEDRAGWNSDYALESIGSNYERYLRATKASFFVQITETEPGKGDRRSADIVSNKVEFEIISNAFRFYITWLKEDDEGVPQSIWRARNVTSGRYLPIRVLSLCKPAEAPGLQRCLVEFIDPDKHVEVGDRVEIVYVSYRRFDMQEMNEGRPEIISIANRHSSPFDYIELVLEYPKSLGAFIMVVDDDKSAIKHSDAKLMKLGTIPEPGFDAVGIQGRGLGPGEVFFVRIYPKTR